MNETEWIKSLDRASSDQPKVDVTASVLKELRELQADDTSWTWFSLAAVLVAGVAVVFGINAWSSLYDPVANLLSTFTVL